MKKGPKTPANAVLFYNAAGFSTAGPQLMGINAASEGFVRALARYAGVDRLTALVGSASEGVRFDRAVQAANPRQTTETFPYQALERVADVGALLVPGPTLASYAWQRQALGPSAYSIIGVTHTTATPRVMDALAALPVAPVQPWDAIVCTSHAVQRMVRQLIDDQECYLRGRFALPQTPLCRPELPVIPLGVDCDALAPAPGLRTEWRARLGIARDDTVALFLGRLSHDQKAHPIPLFQAMAEARRRTRSRLLLVLAGWFKTPAIEADFRAAARDYCPDVPVLFMDARLPDVQAASRALADMFVSPVDNVQETFGLAPLEAMAAGLPVIVSDWDGYRETVRDGVDGFRIPTLAPPPGICDDLALRFSEGGLEGYEHQIGAIGQSVAVDIQAMATAIARLADDKGLRRTMAKAAQTRARDYDWSKLVPRHQALWTELARLRKRTSLEPGPYPARPDPFHIFAGYASAELTDAHRVTRTGTDAAMIYQVAASPLVRFGQPAAPEPADLLAILSAADETSVADLVRVLPPGQRRQAYRAILWLAKYGFVTIAS